MIDAIIAGVVLIAALMYIFNTYTLAPEQDPTLRASEDFLKYLSGTKIRDYHSALVTNFTLEGKITDLDNTLLDQIAEFYYKGMSEEMDNLTQEVVDKAVVHERSVLFFFNGTLLHNRTVSSLSDTKLLISAKRVTFLRVNETTIFGPAWAEVRIWV
ncbi:hypothetical protein JW711_03175 [Candidatus Woesearchaeota archaeon]|nr:hypothetical protein [Candidatus Woesearchaeota archaeon]